MPDQPWIKLGGTLQNRHLRHLGPQDRSIATEGARRPADSLVVVTDGVRPWRMRTAGATLVTGLALGFEGALDPRDRPPVVTPERREKSVRDRIVLYFHPQVPEATLVLIRAG